MRRPRPSTTGIRQLTAVVVPVHLPANPPWPTGPLPFAHGQRRTTSDTRRTYFTPAAARVLYGTPERPVRWH
ncbi:hypothetical protein E1265_17035, partial [Streptomyces sp. 8K308]